MSAFRRGLAILRGGAAWGWFLAMLVGVVSPYLAGRFWIAEILCHFQPQYVAGLLMLAVALAFAQSWKASGAVLMVAIGIFAVHILPIYFGRTITDAPRSLRLLSANVDFSNESPERLYELIDREQPDVILLFELTHEWNATLRLDQRGYLHARTLPSPGHSGSGIFSRLPLDEVDIKVVEPYPCFVPFARLNVSGTSLRIYGTHPWAPYTRKEMDERNAQLANLGKLIGKDSPHTILAGDFNTSQWSPCFSALQRATGLGDSRRGFGLLPTFPARLWPLRTTIDHCLISDDLIVTDRRVGSDIGSDHLPVLVDVAISSGSLTP